jgi:ABC-type sugar transport system permease subunit
MHGSDWYVTLPLMRQVILFAVVLATIYNLQIFDSVFVMTDGGPAAPLRRSSGTSSSPLLV